jgi:Tfp pilus assembly protein PilF
MKKLLLMFSMFSGVAVFAQKSEVESAAIYLRNGVLDDAKKSIDAAAIHDETKNDPKMWFYRAAIYDTLAHNTDYAALLGANGIENYAVACKKCVETDVKDRYSYYCDYAIVNAAFAAYNKGIEYMQNKDAKSAAKYFQYALDAIPYDKDNNLRKNNITEKNITVYLAQMGMVNKDYELAKTNIQKLIDIDYQEPVIYAWMGNIYLEAKDTTKALTYIEMGRTKFQTNKDLINMELNIYMNQGKQDVLLKKLNDALETDNENPTLLFVRGNVYDNYAANAVKKAKQARDTSDILTKKGKAPQAKEYKKLSDSLFRMNKEYVAKAEADYKKVIELKDDNIDAYYNLGALNNNKTTEIVEKMNNIKAATQADYDKQWNSMKKDQDAILNVALGYFNKALEYAEGLPETDDAAKEYKKEYMSSILLSIQQVYANLGDMPKYEETKKKRAAL